MSPKGKKSEPAAAPWDPNMSYCPRRAGSESVWYAAVTSLNLRSAVGSALTSGWSSRARRR